MTFKRKPAITMIETIVYLAIFGVIFLVIVQFMLTISEANQRSRLRNDMERSMIFLTYHLNSSFAESDSIDEIDSVFNNANGEVVLAENGSETSYSVSNGRLVYITDSVSNYLTAENVVVSNFLIERIENTGGTLLGARITIELDSSELPDVSKELTSAFLFNY